MSRTHARRVGDIDRLYARLPSIDCTGRCVDSCTVIRMTRTEHRRIEAAGVDVHQGDDGRCSALTMFGRCSVYAIRPAICRLWGLTRALQCSYGCVPEGGYMTERDAYRWLADVAEAAGETRQAQRFRRVADMPNLDSAVWMVRHS